MFGEQYTRNRKMVSCTCKDLFKSCQKFTFSSDGKFLAAAKKDGSRISVLQLVEDSQRRLHELVLICICYRGFWSKQTKCIDFSPDNRFISVAQDDGMIHIFYIDRMIKAKNNLNTVRSNEVRSCMVVSTEQLLVDCQLPKAQYR